MKALFLIFHGFNPSNGISKKISYQVDALRACGMEVHLCYMDETTSKKRMIDDVAIADYGNGTMSKILKRTEFRSITRYAKQEQIEEQKVVEQPMNKWLLYCARLVSVIFTPFLVPLIAFCLLFCL